MTGVSGRKGLGHPALFLSYLQLISLATVATLYPLRLHAQVKPTYLYNLSSFSGPLRYDWARVHVDESRNEAYVVYQNVVRVFSPSGMEIFSFGDDLAVGQIVDAAVEPDGTIVLLSYKDSRSVVTRCNYRGEPIAPIQLTKLPEGVTFSANRMVLRDGLFYFLSQSTANVIVTDTRGEFRKRIQLMPLLDVEENQKSGAEISGFTVGTDGSVYFTVPTLFKLFKFSADGKVSSFGTAGSGAGKFGLVAGVAVDSRGNILVADKLKCVVMAFDKDFRFLGEFGYRGARPENMILPDDIAIDSRDRLYVSQARRRGVSVFAIQPG